MNCTEAKLFLESCAAGTLSGDERKVLDEHLSRCEGCRLELELTRAVMGAPPVEPVLDLDRDLVPGAGEEERRPASEPPRVLTTQLPDEVEPLELEDLADTLPPPAAPEPPSPSADPTSAFPSAPALAFDTGGPRDGDSLADLAMESPALGGSSPGGGGSGQASGRAGSWSFEPVDVPRAAKPPEESLTLAREALSRTRERGGAKSAFALRAGLWTIGGVLGIGLLAVSVWMALALRAPVTQLAPSPRTVPPNTPETTPATPHDSITAGATVEPNPIVPDPQAPDSTVTRPEAQHPKAQASQVTEPRAHPPSVSKTSSRTPSTAPRPLATAPSSRNVTPPAPATQPPAGSSTRPPAPAPASEPEDDWTPKDDVEAPSTGGVDSKPTPEPPAKTVESQAPPSGSGKAPTPPAPAAGASEPAQPPGSTAEPVTRPIDRLRLATANAEKNGDLNALRKLKVTWKSLIESAAGPDRARAKRDFADCLWAIQAITGRTSDRREALAAYREYILRAPAGGVDARTVSRMRQLEDILSESR